MSNVSVVPAGKSIYVSWNSNEGFGYYVQLNSTTPTNVGLDTNSTIGGLEYNTSYTVRVGTVMSISPLEILWSSYISVTTLENGNAPDAPNHLVAEPGLQSVSLTWDIPFNGGNAITSYLVQYRAQGATNWNTPITVYETTQHLVVNNLLNGTTHDFQVAAKNGVGQGPYSAVATASTFALSDAPTNLVATSGIKSVSLKWDPPYYDGGTRITSYIAQYRIRGVSGSWSSAPLTTDSTPYCVVNNLLDGKLYEFQVAAVNVVAPGSYSAIATTSTYVIPNAPIGLTAQSGVKSVSLSWMPPDDDGTGIPITSYVVDYRVNEASSWNTVPPPILPMTGPIHCIVIGLSDGTLYNFRVAAVNAVNTGNYSYVSRSTNSILDAPINLSSQTMQYNNCGIKGFVAGPPPWSRAGGNNCPNCVSNYGYADCTADNGLVYSTHALDQRRKAEILKYKSNSAQLSSAQQYSMISRNAFTRKKSWATQTQTVTNPNVDNLPEIKIAGTTVALQCNQPLVTCSLTSDSDVPGPVIQLCIDESVPLYNYKLQVTPASGGKGVGYGYGLLNGFQPTPPTPTPTPPTPTPPGARSVITSTSSIFYSLDGTTWNQSSAFEDFGDSISFNTVAYNVFANVWIAGLGLDTSDSSGETITIVLIYYSDDGMTWTASHVPPSSLYGGCSALACNGARWVAGSNINNSNSCVLYYSDDNGQNWNTCTLNYNIFPNCVSVACNTVSRVWMSVMSNSSNNNTATLISTDGINWNQLASASDQFQSLSCHGTTWIASSLDANNNVSFYRSVNDGTSWSKSDFVVAQGTSYPYSPYSFACNGTMWVGVGSQSNANLIYSHDDGETWQPSANGNTIFRNNELDTCNSVTWDDANGKWVAVGGGISVVAYSRNGIHWTPYDPYDVTIEVGSGVAARPANMPPLPAPNVLTVVYSECIACKVSYLDSNGATGSFNEPQYNNGISGYTVYEFSVDTNGNVVPNPNATVIPNATFDVAYLIVGGGGGGGHGQDVSPTHYTFIGGGGGGAGGLLYVPGPALTLTLNASYNLMVGLGGTTSANGANSTFGITNGSSPLIAYGGGGGGNIGSDGASGGSGGGGGSSNSPTATTPGNGISGQGYAGGAGNSGIILTSSGGGGGGAGAPGENSQIMFGGNGGDGLSIQITGISTYYAGGGGGGSATSLAVAQGGKGGGGNGGYTGNGVSGSSGTGGGGGGGATDGGKGGSGIIVIRFRSYF